MTFGDRLRQARLHKGLTQEQLARSIGVAKSTLTGYEKDNREPDVQKIKKILEVLEVDADYLLGVSRENGSIKFDGQSCAISPLSNEKAPLPPDIAGQPGAIRIRLREALQARGVTPEQLGQMVNLPDDAIPLLLSGDLPVPRSVLYPTAHVLQVKVTYLMGYAVPMEREYYEISGKKLSEADIDWFDLYAVLDDEEAKQNALIAASAFLTLV